MPQFVIALGQNIASEWNNNSLIIAVVIITFIILLPYIIFWFLSKYYRVLMLAALIYFGIDTLALVILIFTIGFEFSFLLEIGFHCWIIYYLSKGVIIWNQLRKNDKDLIENSTEKKLEKTILSEKKKFHEYFFK